MCEVPAASHEVIMLLTAEDLVVDLPGDAGFVRVVDRASFALDAGELVDVVGPSGSGKTMLLRALARLLPQVSGSLALGGVPADEIAPAEWRSRVALLPQKAAIQPGSVRANLLLPWTLKIRHAERRPSDVELADALASVHLRDIALDREAARLSVGQAARVALLRVLLTKPQVLLLDEPDAALDDASAEAVAVATRGFAAAGGAVVRVRHQRTDALATRRLSLVGGRLQADEVAAGEAKS